MTHSLLPFVPLLIDFLY